jgi:hypothetical protein
MLEVYEVIDFVYSDKFDEIVLNAIEELKKLYKNDIVKDFIIKDFEDMIKNKYDMCDFDIISEINYMTSICDELKIKWIDGIDYY